MQHQAHCKDLKLANTRHYWRHFFKQAKHSIFANSPVKKRWFFAFNPWFLFYLRYFFKQVFFKGLPFHMLAGLSLGMIATYFSFHMELGSVEVARLGSGQLGNTQLQSVEISRFIIPTFFQEMLSGFGIVLYRALIPLFTCMCIAARAGTATSAYLAYVRDPRTKQWDAMSNLGIEPYAFFTPQIVIAFCMSCILTSYLAFILASLGCLIVTLASNPLCSWYTWKNTYIAGLNIHHGIFPSGTLFFVLKTFLSGLWIALISMYYGSKIRRNSMETMQDLAQANVVSVLWILFTFFILLVIEPI